MTRPQKLIINVETGEEQYLDLTDEEIAEIEQGRIEQEEMIAKRKAEEALTAAAKQSAQEKLKALGLSDVEVAAITNI